MEAAFGPRLASKVVAISGIGSGQGRAAAILFALHGARVVGCDLNLAPAETAADEANRGAEAAASGGCAVALQADAFTTTMRHTLRRALCYRSVTSIVREDRE